MREARYNQPECALPAPAAPPLPLDLALRRPRARAGAQRNASVLLRVP